MPRVCFQQRKPFVGADPYFVRERKVCVPEIRGGVVLQGTLERWSAKAAEGDRSFRRPKRIESLCRDSPPKDRMEGERPSAAESVAQATRTIPAPLEA
jgi:hypothetical protein